MGSYNPIYYINTEYEGQICLDYFSIRDVCEVYTPNYGKLMNWCNGYYKQAYQLAVF